MFTGGGSDGQVFVIFWLMGGGKPPQPVHNEKLSGPKIF